MANPPPPSSGFSISVGPQNREIPSPHSSRSPLPPPQNTPGIPRFTPPILQPNHVGSPSTRTPNLQSPAASGAKLGSPAPHLSTPPGPPVFSSPLRPAAVPIRTSPATPQPVAISSGSTLPTSSPPHFSNGSARLLHQVSDPVEDLSSGGSAPYVLFSAQKVLIFI